MGKIIAVANQKGGVGKTTTSVNLCYGLKQAGKNVLLCDTDPQGNSTTSMGVSKNKITAGTYQALSGGAIEDCIVQTPYGDLLPSNAQLSGAAVELVGVKQREFVLKNALAKIKDKYDYIIVDCPPSLELLTLNSLCAADSLLIPVQCEYFALEGLSDLMTTVRLIKKRLNPDLEIEGVLMTMYDNRTNLSIQVTEAVKKFFRDKVYKVVIPRAVRISEAPSHGKPIMAYDRSCRGARAYNELALEVISRNGG